MSRICKKSIWVFTMTTCRGAVVGQSVFARKPTVDMILCYHPITEQQVDEVIRAGSVKGFCDSVYTLRRVAIKEM